MCLRVFMMILCLFTASKPTAKSRLDEITGLIVKDKLVDTTEGK